MTTPGACYLLPPFREVSALQTWEVTDRLQRDSLACVPCRRFYYLAGSPADDSGHTPADGLFLVDLRHRRNHQLKTVS